MKVNLAAVIDARVEGRYSRELLEHWLAHYFELGLLPQYVHLALFYDVGEPVDTGLESALTSRGIIIDRRVTGTTHDLVKVKETLQDLRAKLRDCWVMTPSQEEMFGFSKPLAQIAAELEAAEVTFAEGVLIDCFAPDFRLPRVGGAPSIHAQFPVRCAFTARNLGATVTKVVLSRWGLRQEMGNHQVTDPGQIGLKAHLRRFPIWNYRWTAGLLERAKAAAAHAEARNYPWKDEHTALLASISPEGDQVWVDRRRFKREWQPACVCLPKTVTVRRSYLDYIPVRGSCTEEMLLSSIAS